MTFTKPDLYKNAEMATAAQKTMLKPVLQEYGIDIRLAAIETISTGLINKTWKIIAGPEEYILQRMNSEVFAEPAVVADNISTIASYLQKNAPDYPFVSPVPTLRGGEMVFKEELGHYRMFPFIKNSHTKIVVQTPAQAYEAAFQFGRFTQNLNGLDIKLLKNTIPGFHDISKRYADFIQAIKSSGSFRRKESWNLIEQLMAYSSIVDEYDLIKCNPEFKLRVTHHDTKISNVLFDKHNKGICVIDLDTVMPGYFFSDAGDMMRTYLCPVSEEEKDFSKIEIRDDFYSAIVQGYSSGMNKELNPAERKAFCFAGKFMIYMQALRFITDYLNNDRYYGEKYPSHNLVRAGNQAVLLQRFIEKEAIFINT